MSPAQIWIFALTAFLIGVCLGTCTRENGGIGPAITLSITALVLVVLLLLIGVVIGGVA